MLVVRQIVSAPKLSVQILTLTLSVEMRFSGVPTLKKTQEHIRRDGLRLHRSIDHWVYTPKCITFVG